VSKIILAMTSQDKYGIHILPKRCRNNGILEEWKMGSKKPISQHSIIPGSQGGYDPQIL
jgi:hypothetical protein